MKRAAVAGFAEGAAMVIGGALGAVSKSDSRPVVAANAEIMNPMIGGQAMLPDRDIRENMTASPMHSQLVGALKDSGIAGALKTNGQFTVFAPTNAAFAAAGPQAKSTLARRMSYLIVPGAALLIATAYANLRRNTFVGSCWRGSNATLSKLDVSHYLFEFG